MLKYQMPWPTGGTVDVYLASDAESAIREARKQGAEEERAAILRVIDGLEFADADDGDRATGYREGRNRCIAYIKARGAAEPVCTCLGSDGSRHYPDCPCHKPPESAPLEKLSIVGDTKSIKHGIILGETGIAKINALIDRVNRIEARGRP